MLVPPTLLRKKQIQNQLRMTARGLKTRWFLIFADTKYNYEWRTTQVSRFVYYTFDFLFALPTSVGKLVPFPVRMLCTFRPLER